MPKLPDGSHAAPTHCKCKNCKAVFEKKELRATAPARCPNCDSAGPFQAIFTSRDGQKSEKVKLTRGGAADG